MQIHSALPPTLLKTRPSIDGEECGVCVSVCVHVCLCFFVLVRVQVCVCLCVACVICVLGMCFGLPCV